MKEILLWHAKAHPSMTEQDTIKLCYQAMFGAEHLLSDKERIHAYFEHEWDATHADAGPLWEPLSDRYGRVHLAAWKHHGLPPVWLWNMFYLTASTKGDRSQTDLAHSFQAVEELARTNQLPFTVESWITTRAAYEANGGGAIHHSDIYRTNEKPSYRVVDMKYISLLPLLQKLSKITPAPGEVSVLAIDGPAASGKTTLAATLEKIIQAAVIHMDDFFLPPALRTPQRLTEPGGNIHYERLEEQVLPHIKNNVPFDYQTFNCSKMQLDGKRTVIASPWRIMEGSYSQHPKFRSHIDFRIFCQVSPQEQLKRIRNRNGADMLNMFVDRWIPMEECYFKTYHIADQADFTFITE